MTVEIKGVHNYHVSDRTKEYLDKKMNRIATFEDLIQDLHVSLSKETNGEYTVTSDIHYRWGTMAHVAVSDRDFYKAIDVCFDKIDAKTSKEKEKIKEH
ncbi:MAG: ribosome-associated translation inhibitor RaiA [Spirochaetales bacterium]|nr:ribosome-associated translation inhibitor RaiA [Spirochaetales bacterium]